MADLAINALYSLVIGVTLLTTTYHLDSHRYCTCWNPPPPEVASSTRVSRSSRRIFFIKFSAFRQMEVLSEGLEVVKHSKNTFGPYGTTRYKIVEYFLASKGFPRTTSTIRDILNEECRKLDKKDAPRTSANSSGGSYFGGGGVPASTVTMAIKVVCSS